MTTAYTVLTTEGTFTIEASEFSKDGRGDVYFYDEGQDDPVGHVTKEDFVAVWEGERELIAPGPTIRTTTENEPNRIRELDKAVRPRYTNEAPIIHCSDGPKLILTDGRVIMPLLTNEDGDELVYWSEDQGSAVYGEEVDEYDVSLAFVDDPEAEEIPAVKEELEWWFK